MSEHQPFTIVHSGGFQKDGKWHLIRRTLGVNAFGINMFDVKPGEKIPEHNEIDRDQEEVFIVLKGDPTVVIDGKSHQLHEGSYVRLNVEPMRYVVNNGTGPATVLIVSAPRTSGYTPMSWA